MEPDPKAPLPALEHLLWLYAFVLGAAVAALQLAS